MRGSWNCSSVAHMTVVFTEKAIIFIATSVGFLSVMLKNFLLLVTKRRSGKRKTENRWLST